MYKPKSKINKDVYNDFIIKEYINNELYIIGENKSDKTKIIYIFLLLRCQGGTDIFMGLLIGEPSSG